MSDKEILLLNQKNMLKVSNNFPNFIFNLLGNRSQVYRNETMQLFKCFAIYNYGSDFLIEGTSGDYVPSNIKFKKLKVLINKEARFMFSQTPEIKINGMGTPEDGDTEDNTEKTLCQNLQIALDKVLKNSRFGNVLLQSAKDCFIAKRVACLVDYSDEDGILLHFYNSLQFYHEKQYGTDKITRFVSFECVQESTNLSDRLYLVNDYRLENKVVYMSSIVYDGAGKIVEELIPDGKTGLTEIPAVAILNDATLSNKNGTSDLYPLIDEEAGYNKLSNADMDSERKGMNPIRYTVDMNPVTTSNLSSGAGSYWDLKHDENLDSPSPQVGTLAPQMNHTEAVKTTLERINTEMYDAMEIPNINAETMVGTITSGKALKALYYPLTVRCDEKFIVWQTELEKVAEYIITFLLQNSQQCENIYNVSDLNPVPHTIMITKKYALMDDETEVKTMAIDEVMNNVMSRKSYMKLYRDDLITDEQIEEELLQIAIEGNMMDAATNPQLNTQIEGQQIEQTINEEVEDIETEEQMNNSTSSGEDNGNI